MNTTQNIRYLHKKLEDVSKNVYCLKQYVKNNPGGGASYTQGVGVLINNNEISAKVDGTTITTNASGQLVAIGGGENIYNINGTLTSARTVNLGNYTLNFTNGILKSSKYTLDVLSSNLTPNSTWTDGVDLWFTNDSGVSKKVGSDFFSLIIANENITLSSSHKNKVIEFKNTDPINITIPNSLPNDFIMEVVKIGSGNITAIAGSGVTLRQVDNTNFLNGGVGSYMRIQRVMGSQTYLIYVRNVI